MFVSIAKNILKVDSAKEVFPDTSQIQNTYFTENLWTVDSAFQYDLCNALRFIAYFYS